MAYNRHAPNQSKIISKLNPIDYLEIGVDTGYTFNQINAKNKKHGVDPYGACPCITHRMPSMVFFALNKREYKNKYDVIFIDGCHISDIIVAEIEESLKILKPGGSIVLHDTEPPNEGAQNVLPEDYEHFYESMIKNNNHFHEQIIDTPITGYNGDSWKAVAYVRSNHPELTTFTVESSVCSVILDKKRDDFEQNEAPESGLDIDDLTYTDLEKNYNCFLNPVTFDFFRDNL
tara:strand:- start:670 stop:1365 length:696 start_codon:yes stop_codon:yes gene_type:complete